MTIIPARVRDKLNAKLAQGSFGRNVLVMFMGTAIGQLGTVLLSPFLTRIYSPESFGVLGSFTALLGIFSVIAALRYELGLPLTRTDKDAANLLAICGLAILGMTLLGVLILLMLTPAQMEATYLGLLAPYRFLLPLGFFCVGAYQILVYYATQQDAYNTIARTKISQGATGPVTQIVLGLAHLGTPGLILGFIVGQSTGSTLLFSRMVLQSKKVLPFLNWPEMKAQARRYRNFPLVSSWAGLINAVGAGLLLVVVPMLYSTAIAGFVFLTERIVGRPLLLISTSILQVYVGEISKSVTDDPGALKRRFLQLAGQQTVIVAGWLLVVNLAAPFLFAPVFGAEWAGAVPYLQVLSIAYLPQMVMHALIHTLQLLEKQALSAFWEVGRLLAVLGAFYYSYVTGLDAWHALLLYSIAQGSAHVVLFGLMYRSIQSLQKPKPVGEPL